LTAYALSPSAPASPVEPAAANGAAPAPAETVWTAETRAAQPAEPPGGWLAQPEPVQAAAAAADTGATESATPGSLRVCDWCGAANPATAKRCEQCGASFPRPEQDDLIARASAERVRLALSEIEMHERLRTPWWKRLFGGKTT
jgi:ribosomal protein L40E